MMQPLAGFADAGNIRFVLTDIDDTLTTHGLFPSKSLAALEALSAAGIRVIPVTGRPAGWCDHIARMWPVDAVVGENGAFWFAYDRRERRMRSSFAKSAGERGKDRVRLDRLRERIVREVEGAGVASDQNYRIADLAIDYCEDVPPLGQDAVRRIVDIFEEEGATAKISSIHVNGWFGSYDKLSMARLCLKENFGADIDDAETNARIVFAGDSPNDQPMFAFFRNGVGVANIRRYRLETPPRWITNGESADGFCELAAMLLGARG